MKIELPPLPESDYGLCFYDEGGCHPAYGTGYTADQMCSYAAAALAAAVAEPVAWTGHDLDGMAEAFSRVIEAHHSSNHPFHNPIDMDAKMALRILRGFIPAMKAHAAPPQREPLTKCESMR